MSCIRSSCASAWDILPCQTREHGMPASSPKRTSASSPMNPVLPRYRAAGERPIAPTKRTNRVVGELTASCICPKSSLALVGFPKPREVFPVWDQPLPVLDSFGQLPRSPAVRWPGTKASRIGFRPSGIGFAAATPGPPLPLDRPRRSGGIPLGKGL